MKIPINQFKARISDDSNQDDSVQYGLWASLADSVATEIGAGAGFDWILIDGEHAPNDLRTTLHQVQALGGYDTSAIVRPVTGDVAAIKQLLDIGVQTVLIPMVESVEQAELMVKAVRYPTTGIRGVAGARGSRWGRVENYWEEANDQMCVILQIESITGLANLSAIAEVEGVDGLFVGPADLAASLGHLGNANHPEVRAAVSGALRDARKAGKAAGVLAMTPDLVKEYTEAGANFVGVGVDTLLLANATSALLERYRSPKEPS